MKKIVFLREKKMKNKIRNKLKKIGNNNHATISFAVVFIFLFVVTVFLFAVAIPMTLNINTAFFSMGDDMLEQGLNNIQGIEDPDVQNSVEGTLNSAKDSFSQQANILGFFAQYGWIFVIIIILFIIVIAARKQVESEIQ